MLTPRRVPLLTPEISRSFGDFRIVNKEKYVMLNEKGLIFCTFYVIISGKAAGWCVKRLESMFPDIPGERCSIPCSNKIIPPALRATSAQGTPYGRLFKGGLLPLIMFPEKRADTARNGICSKGNTVQSPPDGFARNLLADFPSYCPEIPCQTQSLPAEFLCNLSKNPTAHLTHKLCAVLPFQIFWFSLRSEWS